MNRAGFALYRGIGSAESSGGTVQRSLAGLTLLTPSLLAPSSGAVTDPDPPVGVPVYYVLADSAAGAQSRLATFSAPLAPVPLRVWPAPVRFAASQATIVYTVPSTGGVDVSVTVRVLDVRGRVVAVLRNELRRPGPDAVTWDGRVGGAAGGAPAGSLAPSGVYFVVVDAGGVESATKFSVLR